MIREKFGVNRLIYGSNWPVCERFARLDTVRRIVQNYVGSDRSVLDQLSWRNAVAVCKCRKREGEARSSELGAGS